MTPVSGLNPAAGSALASGQPAAAGRRSGNATAHKIDTLVAEAAASPALPDPTKYPPEIPNFPIPPLDVDTGRGIRAYQVAQARANASAVTLGLSQRA